MLALKVKLLPDSIPEYIIFKGSMPPDPLDLSVHATESLEKPVTKIPGTALKITAVYITSSCLHSVYVHEPNQMIVGLIL